jgi:2-C-methyl-D-erythritol 4-phosphate cytidylyltransferase
VVAALVAAAGSGERLGRAPRKALVPLAGRPMVAWSLAALAGAGVVELIVVAAPPELEGELSWLAREWGGGIPSRIAPGGDSRSASVKSALEVASEADTVVVHDAARPLVTPALVRRCVEELSWIGCDGVIAAVRATDTIKQADRERKVVATLDRETLWRVQTPQAFRAGSLRRALEHASLDAAYDDAELVEKSGGDVRILESGPENLKVTTAFDLRLAETLLSERS